MILVYNTGIAAFFILGTVALSLAAYTGIILFLIYGFSNPYSEPAAISPASLERLYAELAPQA